MDSFQSRVTRIETAHTGAYFSFRSRQDAELAASKWQEVAGESATLVEDAATYHSDRTGWLVHMDLPSRFDHPLAAAVTMAVASELEVIRTREEAFATASEYRSLYA